eukprot:COSAG06_NODE_939_length_11389_cov_2.472016_12_plen_215_part_00
MIKHVIKQRVFKLRSWRYTRWMRWDGVRLAPEWDSIVGEELYGTLKTPLEVSPCFRLKTIFLPRQARDRHRENSKERFFPDRHRENALCFLPLCLFSLLRIKGVFSPGSDHREDTEPFDIDGFEGVNLAMDSSMAAVKAELVTALRLGWRAALPAFTTRFQAETPAVDGNDAVKTDDGASMQHREQQLRVHPLNPRYFDLRGDGGPARCEKRLF